jgi:VWFA-related protein
MRRSGFVIAGWLTALGALALAQQAPPVFRAGVDIVRIDVTVLDKDRNPVHGLTTDDFQVLEEGKPRQIVALSEVNVAAPAPPPVTWMRDITPDVTTNDVGERRLIVLLLDTAMNGEGRTVDRIKKVGTDVIDQLGPDDLMAIVSTADNSHTQNFTNDRTKLLAALASVPNGWGNTGGRAGQNPLFASNSIGTVRNVADFLIAQPDRRKALIYVSEGVPVNRMMKPGGRGGATTDQARLPTLMDDALREAQRANVSVYAIDPNGVDRFGSDIVGNLKQDYLSTMADRTGGFAMLAAKDFVHGVEQIFRESGSYYLLGFQPGFPKENGEFRQVVVRMNRPGLTTHTQSGYYAPRPETKAAAEASPLTKAMSGILPKSDLPLGVTVAPFALSDGKTPSTGPGAGAALAITLGIERPARGAGRSDDVDVRVSAFTLDGQARGSVHQAVQVPLWAGAGSTIRSDVLTRIDLAPGRYELRLSAASATLDTLGSVYADVDVPDFAREPLSLSGVVLSATSGVVSTPKDTFATLLPIVPTSQREFYRSDRVAAFLRLYEGGKLPIASATLHTHITDGHDRTVFDETSTIAATDFDASTRAADHRFDLPIAPLPPGEYVLTFEAANGATTVRRDVRFSVR